MDVERIGLITRLIYFIYIFSEEFIMKMLLQVLTFENLFTIRWRGKRVCDIDILRPYLLVPLVLAHQKEAFH